MTRYNEVLDSLRTAYDGGAADRERSEKPEWKRQERETFLERLRAEDCQRLLEVGAGTGQDSAFFLHEGLDVLATDLSPVMVAHCRAKGVDARVADFLNLEVPPASFDAVYAFNCLLHVPNTDLSAALEAIQTVMKPGGLFFLGVYRGRGHEGPLERDDHVPWRFFSWCTDEQIQRFTSRYFETVDFHVVESANFQSLTLRRPR
ncbi:class I SAM-dependent methyltransferase [Actinopolymorpha pittospori]|uniref:SAM-dependent methyltransferase n=1 Tax=Actinopolymorpha pittospori TaxID=648752 RepID=A0A927RAH3_9ACTN|nr:class I SAM-dependent methyltransferase [Actinopolymorpha pittospori]MBE1605040.1 SAM-dependent methyltransferase [Actinopolymorpha pittospori]